MLLSSELKKGLDFAFYRYRHILIYIVIGLFSLVVELLIRKQMLNFGFNSILSIILSITEKSQGLFVYF